jgi:HEAT repeat protein
MLVLVIAVAGCTAATEAPNGDSEGTPGTSESAQDQTTSDGEVDVEALIDTLLHNENPEERWWAAAALGDSGDTRAVGALIQALKQDEHGDVRSQAAWALGQIGDPETVPELIQATEDREEGVRWQAARALGEMGDLRAVEPLCRALREDHAPYVRHHAAWALGEIGSESAVEPLIEALESDASSYVRHDVAVALGAIGDTRSVEPLIDAFQDRDAKVRWEVVKALGEIGEAAVEPLVSALQTGPDDIPWFAAFSLEKIDSPEAERGVDEFLRARDISLEEVGGNYMRDWSYEVMVLSLERHGTTDMARYYARLAPEQFEDINHWLIVVEAAEDWLREHS